MFATLRDAGGQSIAAAHTSEAFRGGYVYSQCYNLIKTPFDAAKVYVFNSDHQENIALDPAYVRTLHKAGGAVAFTQKAGISSFLHQKKRAQINLRDNAKKSYGIREEHRISIQLLDEICKIWSFW